MEESLVKLLKGKAEDLRWMWCNHCGVWTQHYTVVYEAVNPFRLVTKVNVDVMCFDCDTLTHQGTGTIELHEVGENNV